MKRLFLLVFLKFAALASMAQTADIHFLSVNDMHAAIERFPQFAVIVDSLRNEYPDLLVVSGGDNRTGNPVNDIHPESCKPMVDLMNAVGFNYSAIGNHEFDGGTDGLRTVINNSYFKYLCANVYVPDSLRLHIEPFTITERNGVRIGILGLVQVDERKGIPDAHPNQFTEISFRQANEVAKEYAWMRDVCDVFVLLTHNGLAADLKLAQVMPEADLIIGGHSHTLINPSRMENNVMITQAGRWLKNATLTTVSVKDGKVVDRKAEIIDVDKYPGKDQKIQKMIDEFSDNPVLMRVLTKADADFTEKEELGCLMADAIRFETGADIALQNSGGVRYDTKPKGDFTVNDVYRLDPFGNEVIEYELTGDEVVELLAAVAKAEGYGASYVSGIKYMIHFGKGHGDVKKVKAWTPDGKKIDPKKTYKLVMNSYMATTTDFPKKGEGGNLFVTTTDLIIKYLEKQPSVDYTGVRRVEVKFDEMPGR